MLASKFKKSFLSYSWFERMSHKLQVLISELRNQKPIRDVFHQIKTRLDTLSNQFTSSSPINIMHVCGTHEDTLMKNGLRFLLEKELDNRIRMIAGPGCPVCVSPVQDIDFAVAISELPNIHITSFGDMIRVPASTLSLAELKKKRKINFDCL